MTDINNASKKMAAKPDMTPLVDLGFLLITFFIYTTTFTQANIMEFNTPSSEDVPPVGVRTSNTITFVLGENNRIFWYQTPLAELTESNVFETDYSPNGLRNIIMQKKAICLNPKSWTVIIKPTDLATWQNTVDVLDETIITNSELKAVTELSEIEKTVFGKLLAFKN